MKGLGDITPPIKRKELQAFLGRINYLSKFSCSRAGACESPVCLTLASNQRLFNKAKLLMKEDACNKFYKEMKPLYIETDAILNRT